MIEVVNPFDSTGFTGKKKADQTGRRNFFGRGIKNNANHISVLRQNSGILPSMIYKQRFF